MQHTIPKSPIRFIFHLSKQYKLLAFGAIVTVTIAQILMSLGPYIYQKLIDGLMSSGSLDATLSIFGFYGCVYILIWAGGFALHRTSGFIGMQWLTKVNQSAYTLLYNYVTKHSYKYFTERFAGAISNKISNASDGTDRLLQRSLWGWYTELISVVIGAVLLLSVDSTIMIAFIGMFILMFFINLALVKRRRPYVVAYAAASSKFRGEGVDLITNMSAVRQYAHASRELNRLEDSLIDRRMKELKQWKMSEWSFVLNNALVVVFIAGVMGYLYYLVGQQLVTAGSVVLVLMVMGRMTKVLNYIGGMLNGFIREYGEIQEGLDSVLVDHEVLDVTDKTLVADTGEIVWDNVSFTYTEQAVFKNFNLTIKPGERIGLVGASGAGKTTFVSLLLRQHDVDGGAIRIDGQNISEVTQDSLRENIAVVPQEPLLFHRSIKENILYGKPDATEEEIIEVAKKAQAHDFVTTLPEGYDTLVGERGVKLSGGQKQRVAIARAMLKNAPILVLDEATSALDSESEVAIQQALHELMEGKTVIAVAHRLSTLREMDRILVLEGGEIIEDGDHKTLVKQGGVYAKLWDHQAGGFLQE